MPPTRYLRLGYPEWGDTDFDLTQAYDFHQQNVCPCGCGGWRPDCCGSDPAVQCTTVTSTCKGGVALAEWHKNNPEPEGGTLIGLDWTTPDTDGRSLEEQTRADVIDMYRRNGLPIPDELN